MFENEPTIADGQSLAPGRRTGFLLARAQPQAHALFVDAPAPVALTPKSFGSLAGERSLSTLFAISCS